MHGRALLIGSAFGELSGVENDVDAMGKALSQRGLTIECCVRDEATRAGILSAYERMIAAVEPGDAAVVYYSGHGGRVQPPAAPESGPDLMDLQYIVPVDFAQSTAGDFRGITSMELSVLQARLTQRTDNVTTVLDCCHASHMSREGDLRVKALPQPAPYERLRDHIDRLRDAGLLDTGLRRPDGNLLAVRIAACAPEQSAFEYEGNDGRQIGILTESLTMALQEAGSQRVSWATLLDRVRRRVLELAPAQRPEAEGPSRRIAFETAEDDPLAALPVSDAGGGRVRLECAPLLGVRRGDTFLITGPGADPADGAAKVGDLLIDRVEPLAAQGSVTFAPGRTAVPPGARAHPVAVTAPALPVRLPDDPRAGELAAAVAAAPLLRAAEPGERWLAEVRAEEDGGWQVGDRVGPLHDAYPGGAAAVSRVVGNLNALARAEALRRLAGDARWALGGSVAFEWGRVEKNARRALPPTGATVHRDDHIYVSVRNQGPDVLFASLIDIGVAGAITVLTQSDPSGVRLAAGHEYVFGFDAYDGVLTGEPLTWPQGLDPRYARTETLLLLLTDAPQDVTVLGQAGASRDQPGPMSPLHAMLAQIATGRTRDLKPGGGTPVRYDVRAIDFELDPAPDEGGFLIDQRPNPARRHLLARGAAPAGATPPGPAPGRTPSAVALRIEELTVHRNRALFGADIRFDAIVLTGQGAGADPLYKARTERFSNIRHGDSLPLDRMLAYYGPTSDFLDIALWVSRDAAGGPDLSELISGQFAGAEMQEALTRMGGAMGAIPYAAAATAAVGLGAVLVNVAYKLLRATVHDVIGLYRGSMLAGEAFGVGRHPAAGALRVQDFSLAFSIEDVS